MSLEGTSEGSEKAVSRALVLASVKIESHLTKDLNVDRDAY